MGDVRKGKKVGPNPWDGMTLEWVTDSPPIPHNFEFIPPIRSERPVWDLNHPDHPTLPHGKHARELAHTHHEAAMAAVTSGGRPSSLGGPITEGNGHANGRSNGDGAGGGTLATATEVTPPETGEAASREDRREERVVPGPVHVRVPAHRRTDLLDLERGSVRDGHVVFGCFAYGLMFVFMLLVFLRRKRIPRAEDRPDATMEEGEGEIAFFPANSMWPVAMGLGAVGLALGLAFGKWCWVIGGVLMLGALIGFTVEAESR